MSRCRRIACLMLVLYGCAPQQPPPVPNLPGPAASAGPTGATIVAPPVTYSGNVVVVAGKREGGYAGDGGQATEALLQRPVAIAFDRQGNLYVVDAGNWRLRKVRVDGRIETILGNGLYISEPLTEDSLATTVPWSAPKGLAVDSKGNLYVPTGEGGAAVRGILQVTPAGWVRTRIGRTNLGYWNRYERPGPGFGTWVQAEGLACDDRDNLYISDQFYEQVYRLSPGGLLEAIAGAGSPYVNVRNYGDDIGDGGLATKATLRNPRDIAVDQKGNVYVIDQENARIRKIDSFGTITTAAGDGVNGFRGDGIAATEAHINQPEGLAIGVDGSLYIADTGNRRVRHVSPDGVISSIVHDEDAIRDVAIDPQGRLYYIAGNQIKRLDTAMP